MDTMLPFFKAFRTPGGYYLYDVNKNAIIKIKKEDYRHFEESEGNDFDFEEKPVESLREKGYLSSNKVKDLAHYADDILEYYLECGIGMLILQVTQQCNFRCGYCTYSGNYSNREHSNKKMDFGMAKRCIDFYLGRSSKSDFLGLAFYGGEPLLEFELIKSCIGYAESKAGGREIIYNITTNGTLLSNDILSFLEYHGVNLLISLDGPREIHDKNRKFAGNGCGSFDKIMQNIDLIKGKFPEYAKKVRFSTVIDPESDFARTCDFFANNPGIHDIDLMVSLIAKNNLKKEYGFSDEFQIERDYETFKLFLSKTKRLDKKYTSKLVLDDYNRLKTFSERLKPSRGLPEKSHHSGPCIPGVSRFFVNVDGDFYPCERVSEVSEAMKIGNIRTGFDHGKIRALMNIGKLSEEMCKKCWAFRFCQICAAFCDNGGKLDAHTKSRSCSLSRHYFVESLKNYCTLREFNHDFEEEW